MAQRLTGRGTVRLRIIRLAMGLLLIVTACSGGSLDGTWHLGEMLQPDGSMAPSDPMVVPTLIVDGDTITGNTGCNTFTGEGVWPGAEWNLTMTSRSCAENSLNQQGALYVRNLLVADEADIDGDTMTARDADGEVILVFMRVPA